jgi:hypothetical protein
LQRGREVWTCGVCGRTMDPGARRVHLQRHVSQERATGGASNLPTIPSTLETIALTGAAFVDPAPVGLGTLRRMHVRRLKAAGLAEWEGGRLRLTAKGQKVLNGELLQ